MVYIRLTEEIRNLVQSAGVKKLLGCHPKCDKQIISYDDIDLLVTVVNKEQGKTLKVQDLIGRSDLADEMMDHLCNENLLTPGNYEEVKETIDEWKEKESKREKTIEEKEDEKQHEREMNMIRNRVERKKYNKLTRGDEDTKQGAQVKEFSDSLAFGWSFISLMFLGFVTGYYLGKYVMMLEDELCYVCSIVVGILTMVMETILYIIKVEKAGDKKEKKKNIPKEVLEMTRKHKID